MTSAGMMQPVWMLKPGLLVSAEQCVPLLTEAGLLLKIL